MKRIHLFRTPPRSKNKLKLTALLTALFLFAFANPLGFTLATDSGDDPGSAVSAGEPGDPNDPGGAGDPGDPNNPGGGEADDETGETGTLPGDDETDDGTGGGTPPGGEADDESGESAPNADESEDADEIVPAAPAMSSLQANSYPAVPESPAAWTLYAGPDIESGADLQAAIVAADSTPTHIVLNRDIVSPNHIQINAGQAIMLTGDGRLRSVTAERTADDRGPVIEVNGSAKFFMDDVKLTGGYNPIGQGGGVRIGDERGGGGTFVMYGGEITENYGGFGGGVSVYTGSKFYLFGGDVGKEGHGNLATFSNSAGTNDPYGSSRTYSELNGGGAGVYVYTGGTFIMSGGHIRYNNDKPPYSRGTGDGVWVTHGAFIMSGGSVDHNSSRANERGRHGIVISNGSTFDMNGDAVVSDNTSNYNGSVNVEGGSTFNMRGGQICRNFGWYGGGVTINRSTFNMSDGVIGGDTDADSNIARYAGGVYLLDSATFNMSGGRIRHNVTAAPEYQEDNYGGSGSGVWAYGTGVTVNLSGTAEISDNTTFNNDGGGICAFGGATVNVSGDALIRGNKAMIHPLDPNGNAAQPRGGGIFFAQGSLSLGGNARVEGNRSDYIGGGICINSGSLNIGENVRIDGNSARNLGGGIYINSGSLNIGENVRIDGNSARNLGGGIYATNASTITAEGNITDNTAATGGGIALSPTSTLTLSGGAITGNTASGSGGGIFDNATWPNFGNLSVTGDVTFSGNRAGNSHLPYTMPDTGTWTGELSPLSVDPAHLTLTTTQRNLKDLHGLKYLAFNNYDINAPKEDRVYTAYYFVQGPDPASGETTHVGGYVAEDDDYTVDGTAWISSSRTHLFLGWAVTSARDQAEAITTGSILSGIIRDVLLYDVWRAKAVHAVTFDTNGGSAAASQSVIDGETAVRPDDPTRTGYAFTGWFESNVGRVAYDFDTPVTAPLTIYAAWRADGGGRTDPPTPPDPPGPTPPPGPEPGPEPDPGPGPGPGPEPTPPPERGGGGTVAPRPAAPVTVAPAVVAFAPAPDPLPAPQGAEPPAPAPKPPARVEAEAQQTANPLANILNGLVPLGGFTAQGAWSLLSALLGVIGVVLAALLAIEFLRRRRNGLEDAGAKALLSVPGVSRLAAVVFGVLTLAVWLALDDLTQPMIWINRYTAPVIALFALQIVCVVLLRVAQGRADVTGERAA